MTKQEKEERGRFLFLMAVQLSRYDLPYELLEGFHEALRETWDSSPELREMARGNLAEVTEGLAQDIIRQHRESLRADSN